MSTTWPGPLPPLQMIIDHLKTTDPDTWWAGPTFRSPDGTQHCVLSHIAERWGMDALDEFESTYSTSYVIGAAINDQPSDRYPQEHPRERCVAYLEAMLRGDEDDVNTSMDRQYAAPEQQA